MESQTDESQRHVLVNQFYIQTLKNQNPAVPNSWVLP